MLIGGTATGQTQVLDGFNAASIDRAVSILRSGGLVAFPTETVYGLGADGLNQIAVAKIFEAKGRPSTNPLILHVPHVEAARPLASHWPDLAARLAEKFWPGPLTIILPASEMVPGIVRAGNPSVALRSPNHPVALELLNAFGGPLAAPSANKTTETSPTKPEHVLRSMGGRVNLILDGGRTPSGIESTIIDLTASPPILLRPGPIPPSELEAILGDMARFEGAVSANSIQAAPGMSRRHYAPMASLTLHEPSDLVKKLIAFQQASDEKIAVVVLGDCVELPPGCNHKRLPDDPNQVSSRLYAVLHDLDSQGYQRILFQRPPSTDDWLAVRDRLDRASDVEADDAL
ncbi:MAG: L-threonylcarbamoyladenylate synthase [Holophagaceae bacterium]|nr:L-threonylcarbamoyladenylate synthase [Holophagaceae bacterium]